MFRHHVIKTVAVNAAVGWIATTACADGPRGSSGGPGTSGDDFVVWDPMRQDQGFIAWDSEYDFTELGMSPFGVVVREFKKMPSEFDAAVTVDASKSVFWGFGVAGRYSPKDGYSGVGIAADADTDIGIIFACWDRDEIVDMVRIDVDAAAMINSVHRIKISVRDDIAYAAIDGQVVGTIEYAKKYAGSQIVFASGSDGATYFRDMSITNTIPTPAAAVISSIAGMTIVTGRRRREFAPSCRAW